MGEKTNAFWKGGCGCIVIFAVLGLLALLAGGRVHADIGGVILLFIIGGILGLIVLWIYNMGKNSNKSDE